MSSASWLRIIVGVVGSALVIARAEVPERTFEAMRERIDALLPEASR